MFQGIEKECIGNEWVNGDRMKIDSNEDRVKIDSTNSVNWNRP